MRAGVVPSARGGGPVCQLECSLCDSSFRDGGDNVGGIGREAQDGQYHSICNGEMTQGGEHKQRGQGDS